MLYEVITYFLGEETTALFSHKSKRHISVITSYSIHYTKLYDIIVMNPEISSFSRMLQYELEPEIYSFEILKAFNLAVERQGLNEVPIHLKIDTGMNRLGFLENQINELISLLHTHNKLKVSSVFSHLAGSDDAQP